MISFQQKQKREFITLIYIKSFIRINTMVSNKKQNEKKREKNDELLYLHTQLFLSVELFPDSSTFLVNLYIYDLPRRADEGKNK